jgi:nucleoside-diphosphate-sugar epimerase
MQTGSDSDRMSSLARIALAAFVCRYRLDRGRGFLFLLAAVFDPYIYALTVYFVLATVFKLDGIERFTILLIGFMAFRWGISSLLGAASLVGIARRMAEHSPHPLVAAIVAAMAPPACVFAMSMTSAVLFALAIDAPTHSLNAAGWLIPIIAIQGVWIVTLILVLAVLRIKGILSSDVPVVVAASLFWILSPVMYTFRDIPEGASKLLTSYNPVSHLLAAYQNAFWYGQPASLEVLPALTAVGILVIWAVHRYVLRDEIPVTSVPTSTAACPGFRLIYVADDEDMARAVASIGKETQLFVPWRARFRDLRGEDLVRILVANWGGTPEERRRAFARIAETGAAGRLFHDFLAIYPDQVLDQLAFAVAVRSPGRSIGIGGLLDNASPNFLSAAWRVVARGIREGRSITLICERPLMPPDDIDGTFEVWRGGRPVIQGAIGPALAEAYDEMARRSWMNFDSSTDQPLQQQMPLPFTRVLVTGGSSQIGRCLLRRLKASGIDAFAFGRNRPPEISEDRFFPGDFNNESLAYTEAPDALVHIAALWHLPRHLDELHAHGIRRVVCFSTTSIFVKQDSSDAGERDLVARTVDAERQVLERCGQLGIACTILRPTLVYGMGLDRNISRAAYFIRRFRFYPIAGGATGLRQPVHADDLAAAALSALGARNAAGKCYEVGGSERLAYKEMIGRIFDAMGLPRRFVPVPGLEFFASFAGVLLRRPEVTGEMVRRMRRDLVCDNGPAIRDLGYNPRPFLSAGAADLPH